MSYNNPLVVVEQYFTNIAAIQNMAVLQQIWLYEIIVTDVLNATMRVNGAWIKRYCISCSKTYNTLHSCHNFPAGSRQAASGARICETSLLQLANIGEWFVTFQALIHDQGWFWACAQPMRDVVTK